MISVLIIFFSAFIFSCGDSDQTPALKKDSVVAPKPNPVSAEEGAKLYQEKCSLCHGADGKAGSMGAADLSTSTSDYPTLMSVVRNGKNKMGGYDREL